jgi:threonine dehydratase
LRTPVKTVDAFSSIAEKSLLTSPCGINDQSMSVRLFFKCENLQQTGSFKYRGAYNFLLRVNKQSLRRGIVTYSTGMSLCCGSASSSTRLIEFSGNHAIALCHAVNAVSQKVGFAIPVRVIMSKNASRTKVDKVKSKGGRVTLHGGTLAECARRAEEVARDHGSTLISTSGHPL